jgi:RNA polymerase primary sigma factor
MFKAASRLSKEEETRLAKLAQSSDPTIPQEVKDEARNKIILGVEAAAWKLASSYARGDDRKAEELKQEAMLVLTDKFYKYDPDHGVRYLTYAMWWMRQAVQRYQLHITGDIRVPIGLVRFCKQTRDLTDHDVLNGKNLKEKYSSSNPVTMVSLRAAAIKAMSCQSFQSWADADRSYGHELIEDGRPSPDMLVAREQMSAFVNEVLEKLSAADRKLLEQRLTMTLAEIAAIEGVSKERIRQREAGAHKRFRQIAASSSKNAIEDLVIENNGEMKEPGIISWLGPREAKSIINALGINCTYAEAHKMARALGRNMSEAVFNNAKKQLKFPQRRAKKGTPRVNTRKSAAKSRRSNGSKQNRILPLTTS